MKYQTRKNLADMWARLVASGKPFSVSENLYFSDEGIKYMTERSPAEEMFWAEIRQGYRWCEKLMPECQIGNYFADFADPWKRIIVEVDGREWHRDREEKDAERQRYFESRGYKVYRMEAAALWRDYETIFVRHFGHDPYNGDPCPTYEELIEFYRIHAYEEATCFFRMMEDQHG